MHLCGKKQVLANQPKSDTLACVNDRNKEKNEQKEKKHIRAISGGEDVKPTTTARRAPTTNQPNPPKVQALPQMKDKFFAMGNSRGLKRHPFVHAVFMHLYETTKGLHIKADAARVVAMLDELFDQIGGGRGKERSLSERCLCSLGG